MLIYYFIENFAIFFFISKRNKKSVTYSFNLLILCEIAWFSFLFQFFSNVETAKQIKKKIKKKVETGKYLTFNKNYPAGIYLLKVNNRNTRTRCEICSKLTIKTLERRH